MIRRIVLLLLVTALSFPTFAYEGQERIIWDKRPIKVVLKVNEEKLVRFPKEINHWMPDGVTQLVSAQSVGDTFYVKAYASFPPMRFRVRERESGQIYLLDVSAEDDAEVPDTLVVVEKGQADQVVGSGSEAISRSSQDPRVRLTRVASQELYAPARVREPDPSVSRTPIKEGVEVQLVRGGLVNAITVASWRSDGWYVHAIKLVNTSSRTVSLDPRSDLRGRWSTATFQREKLGAKDSGTDTTTVFLTSSRTFFESLNEVQEGI